MKKICCLLLVCFLAIGLIACAPASDTSEPGTVIEPPTEDDSGTEKDQVVSGDAPYIIFAHAGEKFPYVASEVSFFKQFCEENGYRYDTLDSGGDTVKCAANIRTAIQMKPDVLVIMYNDATTEGPAQKEAWEAGIHVICTTGMPDDEFKPYTTQYCGIDDYTAGQVAARMMHEVLEGKGNVVSIEGNPGNQTSELRNSGFADELKNLNSEIKIIGHGVGNWSKEQAVSVMESFLTQYGEDIDGVFGHCDEQAGGAALAIIDSGYDINDFKIVGVGGSKTGFDNVKAGIVYGTTLQSTKFSQTKVFETIKYILDNDLVGKPQQVEPFMNYIDLPAITLANVDQYEAEW